MTGPIQISDSEAIVMEVLWTRHPQGADDIVAALAPGTHWAEPTIKTLLNRLLNKGAVAVEKEGRRYLYAPVFEREAWIAQQSEGFIDRVFGGRVAPLVAHFSERHALSRQDIAELRRLVDQLEDGDA